MRLALRVLLVAACALVPAGAATPASPSGEQRLLVMLVTWGPEPVARADVRAAVDEASAFVRSASFGATWLATDVTPWLRAFASALSSCDVQTIGARRRQAAARAGFDPARYSRLVYVFPEVPCSWGGAYFDDSVWANGSLTRELLAHELGHLYGSVEEGPGLPCRTGRCAPRLYANPYSVMGHGRGDYTAIEKWAFGWPVRVAAPSPGEQTLAAIERPSASAHALRIRTASDAYWLEYRPPFPRWDPDEPSANDGVAVVGAPSAVPDGRPRFTMRDLLLLDPLGSGRPAIEAGQTWVVPGSFRVSVLATTAERARVRFEWIDRTAPGAPRVRARVAGRRVRVTWGRARESGSGVALYEVALDGRTVRRIAPARKLGRIEVLADLEASLVLGPGGHVVRVRALDRAGNAGRSASARVRA